jgi:glutaredoxin-related protein
MRQFQSLLVAILAAVCTSRASAAAPGGASPLAFFRKNNRKEYTPLLFFKAPKGMVPECDFVEKMVSQIEKELGVKVERFDVMRDPKARVLYDKLDTQSKQQLPLLYHRESRQSVYGLTDKNRVRSWAKGRWLSGDYKPTLPAEFFSITEEDGDELEEEMMMDDDADLTPLQRKGKEAMRERYEEDAAKAKKKKKA